MKPNKKQKAILELLSIVDNEGLHYGLLEYGVSKQIAIIDDPELSDLLTMFRYSSDKLEELLEEYREEVGQFTEDNAE